MAKRDAQDARIEAVLGDDMGDVTFKEGVEKFYKHLKASLQLPCDVTGIEDFNWEEVYVFGSGDRREYRELCKTQPSFRDKYELLGIEKNPFSEWILFQGDDLGARVRRKSDGKEFILGLAELKAVDRKSRNYQLLDDFSVWLVNSR